MAEKVEATSGRSPKPGLKWKSKDFVPRIDLEGWITEAEAAELRFRLYGLPGEEQLCPQTIGKWRKRGLIASINFANRIWMVRKQDVIDMPELPEGKPSQRKSEQVAAMERWLARRVEYENASKYECKVTVRLVPLSKLKGWNKKSAEPKTAKSKAEGQLVDAVNSLAEKVVAEIRALGSIEKSQ